MVFGYNPIITKSTISSEARLNALKYSGTYGPSFDLVIYLSAVIEAINISDFCLLYAKCLKWPG